MHLTYHWHAFVEIETWNSRIFIDPFITGNSHITKPLEYFLNQKATHIVLTHWHSDHIGDTEIIAKNCNAQVIASYEIVHYVQQVFWHKNAWWMGLGGSHNFGDFTLKLFQAFHGGGVWTSGNGWACFPTWVIIRAEGKNIYHAGDTALTYDMKLLGEYDSIDVAFLPIGDNFTMGIDDAVIATSFINPKKVVPIHYDTFAPIKVDVSEFMEKVGEKGISLKFGEMIDI
jgi:L-ascorbate metabolism protein UlaG (beta-lactamase superfamily)